MRFIILFLLLNACAIIRESKVQDINKVADRTLSRVGLYLREADSYNKKTNRLFLEIKQRPSLTDQEQRGISSLGPKLRKMNSAHDQIIEGHTKLGMIKQKLDSLLAGRKKISSQDKQWSEVQDQIDFFNAIALTISEAAKKYKTDSDQFVSLIKNHRFDKGIDAKSFIVFFDDFNKKVVQLLGDISKERDSKRAMLDKYKNSLKQNKSELYQKLAKYPEEISVIGKEVSVINSRFSNTRKKLARKLGKKTYVLEGTLLHQELIKLKSDISDGVNSIKELHQQFVTSNNAFINTMRIHNIVLLDTKNVRQKVSTALGKLNRSVNRIYSKLKNHKTQLRKDSVKLDPKSQALLTRMHQLLNDIKANQDGVSRSSKAFLKETKGKEKIWVFPNMTTHHLLSGIKNSGREINQKIRLFNDLAQRYKRSL